MLLVSTDSFFIRRSEEGSWTINFWVALFSLVLCVGIGVVTKEPSPVVAYRRAGWPLLAALISKVFLASILIMGISVAAGVTFAIDGRALFAVIGMGLVSNPLGRLLHTHAPRHAPTSEVAMFTPIETVAASLWVRIGCSEVPEVWTVVGA